MKKIYILIALAASTLTFAQTSLPFSYNEGKSSLPEGLTETNLGSDYSSAPKLKFDHSGDELILWYNQSGGTISFDIKHNPSSAILWGETSNTFTVYQSTNGTTYTELITFDQTTTITTSDIDQISLNVAPESRYLKWVYTNKTATTGGNVALGNINLSAGAVNTTPTLTVSTNTITGLNYTEDEGPSTSQMLNISGENLNNSDVILTAPTNFEISLNNNQFGSSVTLTSFNGTAFPIYVRLAANLDVDSYTGNISINGGGIATPITVTTSGEVTTAAVLLPELTASITSLTDLDYVEGSGPSIALDFEISGTDLDGSDVTITAPTGFLVSTDGVSFDQFITLEDYDGASETILVVLGSELLAGSYDGNISITGGGITTPLSISVSGTVTELVLSPEITINETEIIDLNYNFNEGPSTSQSFNIAGSELDGTNITIVASENFEVSSDNETFLSQVTLLAFAGESTPIHVRLVAELPVETYTGALTINGGGIPAPLTISLTGQVETTASIVENNIEGLKVYPNPASDLVNITSNEIGTKNVTIFNMLGKKVIETSTEETVNVSTLTSGVYIMNITQDGKKASRKLIIK